MWRFGNVSAPRQTPEFVLTHPKPLHRLEFMYTDAAFGCAGTSFA